MTYQSATFADGTSCQLPQDVYEYQANATTVLRRSHADYNLAATYINRRIIGLPSEKTLYEGDPNISPEILMSKVGYLYDENGSILGTGAPVQHDNTNYAASFFVGRGNLTSSIRYDTTSGSTASFVTRLFYNSSGSEVKTMDPAGHTVQIDYTDAFAANGIILDPALSFSTLAYPTTITDPDNYTSSARFKYDFGAVTWKQTPRPNEITNIPGPEQTFTYDAIGRLEKTTSLVNNAYTKYLYGPNYLETFSTVNTVADEAHSVQVFDGHGRAIATAKNHSREGSPGAFSGGLVLYDITGRVVKQSNPTETSVSIPVPPAPINPFEWAPAGDDAPASGGSGWLYTQQTYDWKGRPLVTTNTDGTTHQANYAGCGCAGGEVVTLTDEGTIVSGVTKKRQQKIYSDVLGRTWKTEILNWDGNGPNGTDGTVYSATVTNYNARDQVTLVRQYQGTILSTVFQDTSVTYDGYGRLKTQHKPEQQVDPNNGASTDHTTWSYNPDNTLDTITDARGATTTFGYTGNNRGLVKTRTMTLVGSPTINISYDYDAAGNRTSMNDDSGSKSYSYDQLSRMMSETRTFINVGTFALNYDYNLAGELKTFTDPTGMTINYSHDQTGQLNGVTGSGTLYANTSNYASSFSYRAFGGLKAMTDGTNHVTSLGYNARLQANHFDISGNVSQNYDYHNDGSTKFVHNTTDAKFDRSYSYDHAGRLTHVASGGNANLSSSPVPFDEIFEYNTWGNTTHRVTDHWAEDEFLDLATYTNGRRSGWGYDADGRIKTIDNRTYTYDAAGDNVSLVGQRWTGGSYVFTTNASAFDGDGQKVRETTDFSSTYYLRSSVLGGAVVEELSSSGQKQVGYVYTPGGELLARQQGDLVFWKHMSPSGTSQYEFATSPTNGEVVHHAEFDPLGAIIRLVPPPTPAHHGDAGDISSNGGAIDGRFASIENPGAGCILDGVDTSCSLISHLAGSGAFSLQVTTVFGTTTRAALEPFGFARSMWVSDDSRDRSMIDGKGVVTIVDGGGGQWIDVPAEALQTGPQNPHTGGGGGGTGPGGGVIPVPTRQELAAQLAKDCRVHAMLDTLSYSEGADYGTVVKGKVLKAPFNPELVGQSNVTITDFSRHPDILVQVGPGLKSSAAGRYQFLYRTWQGLGLSDFSPDSQDAGGVMLFQGRGMIKPLLAGNVEEAILDGNREWASLPGSPYGQGTRSMKQLLKVYNAALASCQKNQSK
jgi:YD repeat-containing protein